MGEDAHNLIAALSVLLRCEVQLFGDNVVPSRFLIDCSMAEASALAHVFNGEQTAIYVTQKLREAFTGSTTGRAR